MKNKEIYEPLYQGDAIMITKDIPGASLKWAKGTVVEIQDNARSPYKNIVTVWLDGSMQYGNPWHVYRHTIAKIDSEKRAD